MSEQETYQSYRGFTIDVYQQKLDGWWRADWWISGIPIPPDQTLKSINRKGALSAAKKNIDIQLQLKGHK